MELETSTFIAHRLARLLRLPSPDAVRNDARTVAAYRNIIADFQNDPVESRGSVFSEQEVGGVFVLGPGNSCDFDFRSEFVGQEPDITSLLVPCAPDTICAVCLVDFMFLQAAATGCSPSGAPFTYPSTNYWVHKLVMNRVSVLISIFLHLKLSLLQPMMSSKSSKFCFWMMTLAVSLKI